jgi:hypothetical protein
LFDFLQGNDETKPKTTHTSDVDSVLENKKKRVSEVAPTSSNLPPRPALKRSATTLTGGGYSVGVRPHFYSPNVLFFFLVAQF